VCWVNQGSRESPWGVRPPAKPKKKTKRVKIQKYTEREGKKFIELRPAQKGPGNWATKKKQLFPIKAEVGLGLHKIPERTRGGLKKENISGKKTQR